MPFRLPAIGAALTLLSVASAAQAEAEEGRVRLELSAPAGSQLLERRRGETKWTVVCEGSCDVEVLPDYAAEHAVAEGKVRVPVRVPSESGAQRITVEIPSKGPFIGGVVGLALGGTALLSGLLLTVIGPISLGPLVPGDCGGEPDYAACERRRADEQRSRETQAAKEAETRHHVGEGLIIAGVFVSIVAGALMALPHSPSVRDSAPNAAHRIRMFPRQSGHAPVAHGVTLFAPIVGGVF